MCCTYVWTYVINFVTDTLALFAFIAAEYFELTLVLNEFD